MVVWLIRGLYILFKIKQKLLTKEGGTHTLIDPSFLLKFQWRNGRKRARQEIFNFPTFIKERAYICIIKYISFHARSIEKKIKCVIIRGVLHLPGGDMWGGRKMGKENNLTIAEMMYQ